MKLVTKENTDNTEIEENDVRITRHYNYYYECIQLSTLQCYKSIRKQMEIHDLNVYMWNN